MTGNNTTTLTSQLIVRHDDGQTEGVDPREIPTEMLGSNPGSLLGVIREKCIDCCCGQLNEVRKCTAIGCALWPFRMGTNPFLRGRTNAGSFGSKNDGASRGNFTPNSTSTAIYALSS